MTGNSSATSIILILFAFSDNLSAENSKSSANFSIQLIQVLECMLTNIIFALTHTYTLEKTKKNHFFLQATMENFEKGLKAGDASASKSVHCET